MSSFHQATTTRLASRAAPSSSDDSAVSIAYTQAAVPSIQGTSQEHESLKPPVVVKQVRPRQWESS